MLAEQMHKTSTQDKHVGFLKFFSPTACNHGNFNPFCKGVIICILHKYTVCTALLSSYFCFVNLITWTVTHEKVDAHRIKQFSSKLNVSNCSIWDANGILVQSLYFTQICKTLDDLYKNDIRTS